MLSSDLVFILYHILFYWLIASCVFFIYLLLYKTDIRTNIWLMTWINAWEKPRKYILKKGQCGRRLLLIQNWEQLSTKRSCATLLRVMLFLCGDVHLNPGPVASPRDLQDHPQVSSTTNASLPTRLLGIQRKVPTNRLPTYKTHHHCCDL